jgi:hypothetical protein
MRLYSFTNYYLSSLQHGLQTAHVVAEMWYKYASVNSPANSKALKLFEWQRWHQTIIIKNGGNQKALRDLITLFSGGSLYPWAVFQEDQDSLGGVIGAVGIVVPEKFYSPDWAIQTFTPWELQLLDLIQRTPLAV